VFSLFLVAALASAAADSTDASEARLLNWSELVTANDYPAVALMKEQEGTVTVRLDVDRTGVVTTCKVVISAGSAALDDQTCALFRARARYIPAHDRRGRPVASTVDQRMAWRLAGQAAAPFPRQAWMVRTNLSLDAAGRRRTSLASPSRRLTSILRRRPMSWLRLTFAERPASHSRSVG
jgi:TonB family protein